MTFIYLDTALDDLVWVRQYYERVFPGGANRAARHFEECERLLTEHPLAGRPLMGGLRQRKVSRTPFSLIYRVSDTRIEVLRVIDERGV